MEKIIFLILILVPVTSMSMVKAFFYFSLSCLFSDIFMFLFYVNEPLLMSSAQRILMKATKMQKSLEETQVNMFKIVGTYRD